MIILRELKIAVADKVDGLPPFNTQNEKSFMKKGTPVNVKDFKLSWFESEIDLEGKEKINQAVKRIMDERMLSVLNKDFLSPLTLAA